MSIRKQYSFPSELSLQRPEPTYTTRPLVSPIAPKEEPTYTTRPLQIDKKPQEESEVTPRPSGGGGDFIPPNGGSGEVDESKPETTKKVDWLPIVLIGVGVIIFVMKPFK